MTLRSRIFVFLIATIGFSQTACFSVKPDTAKGGGKHFEEFFLGENRYQYFIKPFVFSKDGADLSLDITFRYPQKSDTGTLNFTLITNEAQSKVTGIELANNHHTVELDDLKLVYTSRESDNEFHARYSTDIQSDEVVQLLSDSDWTMKLIYQKGSDLFHPARRSQRILSQLQSGLYPRVSQSSDDSFFIDSGD